MQGNFFGSKLNSILLLILIILVSGTIYIMLQNEDVYLNVFKKQASIVTVDKTQMPLPTKEGMLGNKDDLIAFSILPYTKVHGILSYRGVIKGGYFFEGNILIGVADANKKIILQSNAMATTDWMSAGPVSFEGNIDFTGLKKGPAYVQIHNDNPSGDSKYDKSILIPITIE